MARVQSSKYIGIIIDENLYWKPHIQLVKSKFSKTLSIIYRASKLINHQGLFTLFCSLFVPYPTYCCEIWGNPYMSNVRCIFVLQKKVVRTNLLFKQMYSIKLPDLVKYRTAILKYTVYYRKLPTLLQERFKKNHQNVHNTRRRSTCIVHYSRTNLKAMCITIYGVHHLNT